VLSGRGGVTKGQRTLNSIIMGSSTDRKNTRDVCLLSVLSRVQNRLSSPNDNDYFAVTYVVIYSKIKAINT
jgi:hypothetical protein